MFLDQILLTYWNTIPWWFPGNSSGNRFQPRLYVEIIESIFPCCERNYMKIYSLFIHLLLNTTCTWIAWIRNGLNQHINFFAWLQILHWASRSLHDTGILTAVTASMQINKNLAILQSHTLTGEFQHIQEESFVVYSGSEWEIAHQIQEFLPWVDCGSHILRLRF